MDITFLIEIIIVGLIIVGQIWVFMRNGGALTRLGNLFPNANLLEVEDKSQVNTEATSTFTVPQLKDNKRFSSRDIGTQTEIGARKVTIAGRIFANSSRNR